MERRVFIKAVGIAAVCPSFFMSGCKADLRDTLTTIIQSAQSIVKVAAPTEPWLQSFQDATSALDTAVAAWDGSSPVASLKSALNALMAVLVVIPATEEIAPLVAILYAAIDSVLTYLYPQPATAAAASRIRNPYVGKARLMHPKLDQSFKGAYKDQWNAAVAANPKLAAAKL